MKIFKFLAVALVAMVGLNSCSKDCDHDFIDVDHSADLVGTWTCFEAGYAEALVIKADGSVVSTGVEDGEYWDGVKGNIVVKNGTVTMTFEDGDNFKGHFDIVPGVAFSIFTEDGKHMTYNYCKEDLSEEVVGMWICTQTPSGKSEDMLIQNFQEDGTLITTGRVPEADDYIVNANSNYKVFGDLYIIYGKEEGTALVFKFNVSSNETTLGKMMTVTGFMPTENGVVEETSSWLRVKEGLNFTGKTYDYISAYVTNVNGKDEDFSIMGHTFNIAKLKAGDFDIMMRSELFCLETNANLIKYNFVLENGQNAELDVPISVESNKVTLDMSAAAPGLRKVEVYMFQDADDSQLHMYMHTDAFINYFANLEIVTLLSEGKIDLTDADAIEKVFTDMEARVESINVSFVLKARK